MNSLPPPIPPPPISVPPGPASNDDSNFAGTLRYDRLAIASLACLIGSCFQFLSQPFPGQISGLPLFPMALVFGILSLKRIKAEPKRLKGRGMALAGIIIPALLIGLLLLAFAIWGLRAVDGS